MNTHTSQPLYVGSVAGGHHKQIVQEATGTTVALVYDNDDTAERIVKSIHAAPQLAEALRDLMASCQKWAPTIDGTYIHDSLPFVG